MTKFYVKMLAIDFLAFFFKRHSSAITKNGRRLEFEPFFTETLYLGEQDIKL